MNELQTMEPIVNVEIGQVTFNFTELERQAREVADFVSQVEVTEDNIKESKKLIAKVNKASKKLEDERIAVKKELLRPYVEFEKNVKDIVSIIKDADTIVRTQVKELEEIERENKNNTIKDIWDKRVKHYDFNDLISYDDFITPQHLNKSTSLKKIEEEMVDFMESTKRDLKAIYSLDNSTDILEVYIECKDLSQALEVVRERDEVRERIENVKPIDKVDNTHTIEITGDNTLKLVEMLLKQNEIEYKVIK